MTDSARSLAARCLMDAEKGGYSNLIVKRRVTQSPLDSRERAFCSALFYGTLSRQVTLDYILDPLLRGGIEKCDAEIRAALRLGLYSALYMDSVPQSAAVNESVQLAKYFKKSSAAGLCNAVLRKACAFEPARLADIKDDAKRLSVMYSVCEPLAKMTVSQYGAQAEQILRASLARPRVCLRVNTLKTTLDEAKSLLASEGVVCENANAADALTVVSGDWLSADAFENGLVRAQSERAIDAVSLLAPDAGERMLDMCAAPGGKTLTAAQLMRNQGQITALDRSESRLELLRKQATAEGVTIVNAQCADAAGYDTAERFERVLCDVPCSGFGEMCKKPELRAKAPEPDGSPLFALQLRILANGARLLARGGMLVYSTCTLDKRENDGVLEAFLCEHGDFELCEIQRSLPDDENSEGFFAAKLAYKRA